MLFGIDLSHHQGAFDFARARREGFDFAFLKATEGAGFVDARFAGNLAAARAAGLLTAAYHYQRPDSAAAQAEHITRVVPRDCPVILDVESGSGDLALTRDLTARVNASARRTPLLYLPRWYWQQIGSPDLRGLPPLWSSRYPDTTPGAASVIFQRVPASYWDGYGGNWVAVLQFSSSARVAATAPVDANAYGGTRDQLATLLGGSGGNTPGGIDDMALDTQWTDSYGNVQTLQSWMADLQRKVNDVWYPAVSPGSVPSRIPGDHNTTTVFDMIKDNTSWTNQTLGLVAGLHANSGVDPQAIADALRPVVADLVGPVIHESVTAALGADNQTQANEIVHQIAQRLTEGGNNG